jgi:hypothetical protein
MKKLTSSLVLVFFITIVHSQIVVSDTIKITGLKNWIAPTCLVANTVTVQVWGGGGGGAGDASINKRGGGGGGGGGYSRSIVTIIPGNSYTLQVGAGGNGGSLDKNGDNGQSSWFENTTTLLANGGNGGTLSAPPTCSCTSTNGGAGGIAGTGDITFSGGNGGGSYDNGMTSTGGSGGSSAGIASNGNSGMNGTQNNTQVVGAVAVSGGGAGGDGGAGFTDEQGFNGKVPGGGGGGSTDDANGGNGGAGRVIISYAIVTNTVIIGIHTNATSICSGQSTTLAAYGASEYKWSTGATTTTITVSPTVTNSYTVIGNTNSCYDTTTATISINQVPAPDICMVTVDNRSVNNIVYWDKTPYAMADSFIVYREITSNTYKRIGAIHKDSLSQFIDTARNLYFPFTGNPNTGTYRYKLQIRDTCGNYGNLGPYHNTIYINRNGGNFTWNDYQIEGESTPIPQLTSYYLYRDNSSTDNWQVVAGVSGSQLTINDPDYATYPNGQWRIATQWNISCNPTRSITSSYSNSTRNILTGIKNNNTPLVDISVFPNPNNGIVNLKITSLDNEFKVEKIEIVNILGESVYSKSATTYEHEIDLTKESKGIYVIKIMSTNKKLFTQKIVIQ